jgi:competence protein ComEC
VISHAAAVGAAAGAWWSVPVPVLVVLVAVGVALRWRHVSTVLLAAFLVAGFLGHRALAGLGPPVAGSFEGWVTLVDDPRPAGSFGVTATVRRGGQRLEAVAFGATSARLDDRLAGERVLVEGRVEPADSDWLRWRHVVGRLTVDEVRAHDRAAPVDAFANWIRRRLSMGAEPLSRQHRALLTGMILGDDRDQSAVTADDFRAAGLGHLLVVSGQNVAFVLALVAPGTARLRPGFRLIAIVAVLAVFAVLTRFEPSVLRAVTMAGLAVGSAVFGHPENGRRVLAAAVAILIFVDPFLVHAAGFQLSVAATAGIVWLTPRLAEAVPGPRPLALALATTAGAQVAVLPLLVILFGTVPLAALPANLLAGPAAGPVMIWGCTGGMVAGVVGGRVAEMIHWPTALLLWWVASVARAAALAPPVVLGRGAGLVVVVGVLAVAVSRPGRTRMLATAALAVVVIATMGRAPLPPEGWSQVDGARMWRSTRTTVVVLDSPRSPQRLLESLRTSGAGRPDLVVASNGGAADALAVVALRGRFEELAIIAPPLHQVPGARTVASGRVIVVNDATVVVAGVEPHLAVTIRGPPVPRSRLRAVR